MKKGNFSQIVPTFISRYSSSLRSRRSVSSKSRSQ